MVVGQNGDSESGGSVLLVGARVVEIFDTEGHAPAVVKLLDLVIVAVTVLKTVVVAALSTVLVLVTVLVQC